MRTTLTVALACAGLASCNGANDTSIPPQDQSPSASAAPEASPPIAPSPTPQNEAPADLPALIPPGPGEPGGLADDRTPLSEGPIEANSAQGAAQVVQHYSAFLGERRFAEAYALWSDGGRASDMTADEFTASFAQYSEIHALTGAPGEAEGAAGSIYVTVPLQLYGRTADGQPFNLIGPITLRRVNNVPGSSQAQRRWHISDSALRSRGTVREAQ